MSVEPTIQPTYTVERLDTPAGPRYYVVNESAPGNTRKYLASFDSKQDAQGEADARNEVDGRKRARAFEWHRGRDPHCTCNDCLEHFAEYTIKA